MRPKSRGEKYSFLNDKWLIVATKKGTGVPFSGIIQSNLLCKSSLIKSLQQSFNRGQTASNRFTGWIGRAVVVSEHRCKINV